MKKYDRQDLYQAAKDNDVDKLRSMLPLADDGEFKNALLLQSAWGLMGSLGGTKDSIELDRMDDAVHLILEEGVARGIPAILSVPLFSGYVAGCEAETPVERACKTMSIKSAVYLVKMGQSPYIDTTAVNHEFLPMGKPLETVWNNRELDAKRQEFKEIIGSAYNAKQAVNILEEIRIQALMASAAKSQTKAPA